MDSKPADRQIITVKEAAELCARYGLSDHDVKFWNRRIDNGKFPCVKMGRYRRVLRDHIEAYIRRHLDILVSQPPRI